MTSTEGVPRFNLVDSAGLFLSQFTTSLLASPPFHGQSVMRSVFLTETEAECKTVSKRAAKHGFFDF